MFDAFAVDPATFTRAPVWAISGGLVLATGLGYEAYRFGHDRLGPALEEVLGQ